MYSQNREVNRLARKCEMAQEYVRLAAASQNVTIPQRLSSGSLVGAFKPRNSRPASREFVQTMSWSSDSKRLVGAAKPAISMLATLFMLATL